MFVHTVFLILQSDQLSFMKGIFIHEYQAAQYAQYPPACFSVYPSIETAFLKSIQTTMQWILKSVKLIHKIARMQGYKLTPNHGLDPCHSLSIF
jgi:hypothetical protein